MKNASEGWREQQREEKIKRNSNRGHQEDREEGGQAVANLAFIMCHHGALTQRVHSNTP